MKTTHSTDTTHQPTNSTSVIKGGLRQAWMALAGAVVLSHVLAAPVAAQDAVQPQASTAVSETAVAQAFEGEVCWRTGTEPEAGNATAQTLAQFYERLRTSTRFQQNLERLVQNGDGHAIDALCRFATTDMPPVAGVILSVDGAIENRLYINEISVVRQGPLMMVMPVPNEVLADPQAGAPLLSAAFDASISNFQKGQHDGGLIPNDIHRLDAAFIHTALFSYNWLQSRLMLMEIAKKDGDDELYNTVVRPMLGAPFEDAGDTLYYSAAAGTDFDRNAVNMFLVSGLSTAFESGMPMQTGLGAMMEEWMTGIQSNRFDPRVDGCRIMSQPEIAEHLRNTVDNALPWEYFNDSFMMRVDHESFQRVITDQRGLGANAPQCKPG